MLNCYNDYYNSIPHKLKRYPKMRYIKIRHVQIPFLKYSNKNRIFFFQNKFIRVNIK